MNTSHKDMLLWRQSFIAERYGCSSDYFIKKSKWVSEWILIAKSTFMESLMGVYNERYNHIDYLFRNMIKSQYKTTIRHILIPLYVSKTWILLAVELYAKEIQVFTPKVVSKKEIDTYINKLKNYTSNSIWFQLNIDSISSWDLLIMPTKVCFNVKLMQSAMQTFDNDSGVLVCLYIYAKYQGISPIYINLYSSKRRQYLYKSIRDESIAKLHLLFNIAPQTNLQGDPLKLRKNFLKLRKNFLKLRKNFLKLR